MHERAISVVAALSLVLLTEPACKKTVATAPPPAPPPAQAAPAPLPPTPKPPVICEFGAEPGAIERGEFTTLNWSIQGATEALIEPSIGAVQTVGTYEAFPTANMTYILRAKGPGGTAVARTAVSVIMPPPPPAILPPNTRSERLSLEVRNAHFDFERSDLRKDAPNIPTMDSTVRGAILKDFPAHLVRKGAAAVRRIERRVLAEESPRTLCPGHQVIRRSSC